MTTNPTPKPYPLDYAVGYNGTGSNAEDRKSEPVKYKPGREADVKPNADTKDGMYIIHHRLAPRFRVAVLFDSDIEFATWISGDDLLSECDFTILAGPLTQRDLCEFAEMWKDRQR